MLKKFTIPVGLNRTSSMPDVKKGSREIGEELFFTERSEKVSQIRCQLRRCEEGEDGKS